MIEMGGQRGSASACPHSGIDRVMHYALFFGVLALLLILFLLLLGRMTHPGMRMDMLAPWARSWVLFGLFWAFFDLLLLIYKTLLWFQYRAQSPATEASAPPLTVIIPAYIEGPMVANAIVSVISATYPEDRIQIIAIDDGSTDDTWWHISEACERYPGVVTAIRFSENRGKRAALKEGFLRASGEVAVTIDSDSVIDVETLLALVSPFTDAQIGAVAGKVLVHNITEGLIPRMLQVAYILSFDFVRAAQSQYRNVYCCPGALSAYRMSAVRAVLDAWFEQRFLGSPCTYGEDRALSNHILGLGMDIVYQSNAVVHTIVPTRYGQLCKMFLRWYRSFVREEILLLQRIVWKRPLKVRVAILVDKMITDIRYPLRYVLVILALRIAWDRPAAIPWMIFGFILVSILPVLYYLRSDRSWRCLYAGIYAYSAMLALWWILPYAAVTLRSRSWLTR